MTINLNLKTIAIAAVILISAVFLYRFLFGSNDQQAVDALRRVQAAAESGTTMLQYQERLADARVAVDKVCPGNYKEGTRCYKIRMAWSYYDLAAFEWRMSYMDQLDKNWALAAEQLNQL